MPENLAKIITKDQVIAALEYLSEHPEIQLKQSKKYDYAFNMKTFPPKEVVRWAAQLAKIPNWKEYRLNGGPTTNDYLIELKIPGASILNKNDELESESVMPYFDFEGMERYREIAGTQYSAANPNGRNWFKDTESKLEYLVSLLSNHLDEELAVNYTLRPNQQAGRGKIIFSDYILVGCCPEKYGSDNSIFIKIAFHNLSDTPLFTIEIDSNKRLANNKYVEITEPIRELNAWNFPIDQTFPNNWKDLLQLILPEIEKHLELYEQIKQNEIIDIQSPKTMANNVFPLNQILYGPPGTGKTYHTINHTLSIIDGEQKVSDLERSGKRRALTDRFEELRKQGYVEFITFHQNYSYEEFVQGLRPKIESANQLLFEKRDGVFKRMADKALKNLFESANPEVAFDPTFEEVFDDFFKPLIDETGTLSVQMESKDYKFVLTKYNPENDNFDFTKQSGGKGHAIYIPTLKKYFEQPEIDHTQGLKYYYKPLAKALRNRAAQLKKVVSGVKREKYVLIIDEINRANISRVFGELITLIEEDKRWDNDHKMKVRLPSGDEFTVPNNLYIIGTMNTADKSIALLDIALRRRFDFIAKFPDEKLVKEEYRSFFTSLNTLIKKERNADFSIGHSYLMEGTVEKPLDFIAAMNKKIIPLLNEYFYSSKEGKVLELVAAAMKSGSLDEKYSLYTNELGIISISSK